MYIKYTIIEYLGITQKQNNLYTNIKQKHGPI